VKNEKSFLLYVLLIFLFSFFLFTFGFVLYLYLFFSPADLHSRYLFEEILKFFFIWEAIVFVSTLFLIFVVYRRYLSYREKIFAIVDCIFQALEHRLGNFISTQKLNIALIKQNSRIRERLSTNLDSIVSDFKQIMTVLKHLSLKEVSYSQNEREIFDKILEIYSTSFPDKEVCLSLGQIKELAPAPVFEVFLDLLFNNAFKYSASRIQIRWGTFQGCPYLMLRNDLASQTSPGSGLGHRIIQRLAREERLVFLHRRIGDHYLSLLIKKSRPAPFTIFSRDFWPQRAEIKNRLITG